MIIWRIHDSVHGLEDEQLERLLYAISMLETIRQVLMMDFKLETEVKIQSLVDYIGDLFSEHEDVLDYMRMKDPGKETEQINNVSQLGVKRPSEEHSELEKEG